MSEMKSEHLTLEMISLLLEEPEAQAEAAAHVAVCELCSSEHARMRRMLMALSALGEMEPPAGEWERIEASLPRRRDVLALRPASLFTGWPAQAAAAMLVFAGGIAAGLMIMGGPTDADRVADRGSIPTIDEPVASRPVTTPVSEEYYRAVAGLEQLRAQPPGSGELLQNPAAAAERLARLDALILASREALDASPTDPAVNNLLFELVEERDELAAGVAGAVRMAGLEYR
jgi:hypothetical protein